jgi:hypothetical protein
MEEADMRKPSKPRKTKTYGALSELPKVYVPSEAAKRAVDRDTAWIERHLGPDVPRITRPGRPRKGTKVEAGKVRSVRVADSVWDALRASAEATGLSTNAALRLAVLSWTRDARTDRRRSPQSR